MVADTYTSTLGALLMGTGNDNNTWGSNANTSVFQILEDAIANILTEAVTGGTLDLSGTPPPAGPSQVRYSEIVFTGTLASNQVVKVPNLPKKWLIANQTTGAFTLSIITPSGNGSLLALGAPTGGSGYVNGTYKNVPLTGGSGTNATATIVVASNAVQSVTLQNLGNGFLAADTGLSASNANLGGSGSGFSVNVVTVGNLVTQNSGYQVVRCDGAGFVRVFPYNTKQVQMGYGTAAAPSYSDVNETNSGWYRNTTQDWRLSINGTDILQVTGSGAPTPGVVNIVSGALEVGGVQVIPSGAVMAYDGITAPTGWVFISGQAVSRPIANGGSVDTYKGIWNAITATVVGNTNGNTSITGLAADMRGFGLNTALVEGTGIPGGTTITFTGATTATLSTGATGSLTGITLRILPFGQGDASTTFNLRDGRGVGLFGRDDMNGTARGVLGTTLVTDSGTLNGTQLNAGGSTVTSGKPQGYVGSQSHVQLSGEAGFPGSTTSFESATHTHSGTWSPSSVSGNTGTPGAGSGSPSGQNTGTESANHTHTVPSANATNPMSLLNPLGITNFIMKL